MAGIMEEWNDGIMGKISPDLPILGFPIFPGFHHSMVFIICVIRLDFSTPRKEAPNGF
jgi:hypothetical protein